MVLLSNTLYFYSLINKISYLQSQNIFQYPEKSNRIYLIIKNIEKNLIKTIINGKFSAASIPKTYLFFNKNQDCQYKKRTY